MIRSVSRAWQHHAAVAAVSAVSWQSGPEAMTRQQCTQQLSRFQGCVARMPVAMKQAPSTASPDTRASSAPGCRTMSSSRHRMYAAPLPAAATPVSMLRSQI